LAVVADSVHVDRLVVYGHACWFASGDAGVILPAAIAVAAFRDQQRRSFHDCIDCGQLGASDTFSSDTTSLLPCQRHLGSLRRHFGIYVPNGVDYGYRATVSLFDDLLLVVRGGDCV
jgi:hypothetical protein